MFIRCNFCGARFVCATLLFAWLNITWAADGFVVRGSIAEPLTADADRLRIKLYPPRDKKKPVLIGPVSRDGKIRFSGVAPDRYLIELSAGDRVLFQEVRNIASNVQLCPIASGDAPSGHGTNVLEGMKLHKNTLIALGSTFNERVAVAARDIEGTQEFQLKILLARGDWGSISGKFMTFGGLHGQVKEVLFDGVFLPPQDLICFRYGNQTYWLKGRVAPPKPGEKAFLEFDIIR